MTRFSVSARASGAVRLGLAGPALIWTLAICAGAIWAGAVTMTGAQANHNTPVSPPASLSGPTELAPPKKLTPAIETAPLPNPGPSAAPTEVLTTPQPEPGTKGRGKGGGAIRIGELEAIDADSVGLLDADQGGFGTNMWQGTSRSLIERLVPKIPAPLSSPVIRDLARRLLLSSASAPGVEAGSGRARLSLVALRARKLVALGDIGAVSSLLKVASVKLDNEILARVQSDSAFLGNDNSGACKQIRGLIRQFQGSYWQKGLAFCQALAGQHAVAALGADLLREQGHQDDQAFYILLKSLVGDKTAVVGNLANPTPLHLAMMRAARQKLPVDVVTSKNAAILRTVALSPNASMDVRLAAAEQAEAMGALETGALAKLYASINFTPDQLSNALSGAESDTSARGRSLLYNATHIVTAPLARAEILQKAWTLAAKSQNYGTSVRIHLPVLLEIKPAPELAWFAIPAARALLAAGRVSEAAVWLELSPDKVSEDDASQRRGLGLLVRLGNLGDTQPWDAAVLKTWWQSQNKAAAGPARRRAAVLFTILEAFGQSLDQTLWEPLFDGPRSETMTMPAPALLHGLGRAAAAGRIGETVLLTLLSLGEGGPSQASPSVLGAAIRALRQVALESEARALALEAAFGAGI